MSCSRGGSERIGSARLPGIELRMLPTSGFFGPRAASPTSSGSTTMSSAGTASIGMTTALERRTAIRSLAMIARITDHLTATPAPMPLSTSVERGVRSRPSAAAIRASTAK